jgi:hypothetical protein
VVKALGDDVLEPRDDEAPEDRQRTFDGKAFAGQGGAERSARQHRGIGIGTAADLPHNDRPEAGIPADLNRGSVFGKVCDNAQLAVAGLGDVADLGDRNGGDFRGKAGLAGQKRDLRRDGGPCRAQGGLQLSGVFGAQGVVAIRKGGKVGILQPRKVHAGDDRLQWRAQDDLDRGLAD